MGYWEYYSLSSPNVRGVPMSDERVNALKYEFVRRRTYDAYVDRNVKKFDKLLSNLANLESWLLNAVDRIEILEAEIEGIIQYRSPDSVSLPGRKEALRRKD